MFGSPGVHHGIVFRMAGVTSLEPFREHDINALFQGVKVRDGRGRGRVIGGVILGEFTEVKIVAAVFNRRGTLKSGIRGHEDGKTGRKGDGFLNSGEEDIDSKLIEVDGHG